MVFFILGDIDFRKALRTLERVTADIPCSAVEGYHRQSPLPYRPQHLTTHKDTHQAHVMIGAAAIIAYDERRTGLYLLNNILGGPGMNSRLNVSLRERRGLVYNVESILPPIPTPERSVSTSAAIRKTSTRVSVWCGKS